MSAPKPLLAPALLDEEMRARILIDELVARKLPIPPELQLQLYEREAARRGLLQRDLGDLIRMVNPTLLQYEHVPGMVRVAQRVIERDLDRVMVLMPPRYFKALADDTPIATPAGWTTMGVLEAGDAVFAGDGTVTTVLAVQHWRGRPTYAVTGADGDTILADEEHQWVAREPHSGAWLHRTTRELVAVPWRAIRIPLAGALDLPDAPLPIPPYLLGVWLGDGATRGSYLTIGHQDVDEMRSHLEADGYRLDVVLSSIQAPSGAYAYLPVPVGQKKGSKTDSLQTLLRAAGLLQNKHIPPVYFRASQAQRRALLQGLVDSDGTVGPSSQVVFTNTNAQLARDVQQLVWTLGARADLHEYRASLHGQDAGPVWYVTFHLDAAARLPRKAARCHDAQAHNASRPITLTPGPAQNTTCIMVAHPSGLFLAGRSLMVTHNSEVWSKLLPAAYLLRHQAAMVALSSYTAHLAWELSGASQAYYTRGGGDPTAATQARDLWKAAGGGLMWAVGAGGTIVGRGFHLGVVDDPINPEHASSVLYQQRFRHWWTDVWVNRQEPHMGVRQRLAQMVVVMQRLGPSDPIDFLLRREVGEQCELAPEHWHVVLMDEIKSEEPLGRWNGPKGLPPTCTLEDDPRPTGTILAPHRFGAEAVKAAQASASPLTAAAQRQQRPMRAEGAFWRSDWFLGTYETLPAVAYDGGTDWDTAYSQEQSNSACAYVRSFRGPVQRGDQADNFTIYIDDVNWQWVEFPALVKWMRETPGPHYIEQKASGKSAAQSLRQYRIPVQEIQVHADKLARASLAQPVVSQGRVMVQARVVQRLLWGERQGLLRITAEGLQMGGEGSDLNDAFVQALFRHCHLGAKSQELAFR